MLLVANTANAQCVGDCDEDGEVGVDELIVGVRVALSTEGTSDCPQFDADQNGAIDIAELVEGVRGAMQECSGASTATTTPTSTTTPTITPTPRIMEGVDVVRSAAEVAVQNVEGFQVFNFGCVAAAACSQPGGAGGARFAAERRSAIDVSRFATGSGGGAPCPVVSCSGNVQTVSYDDCSEETPTGNTVVRNGTSVLTVSNPSFCSTMQIDPLEDTVILQLNGYTQVERDPQGVVKLRFLAPDWKDEFVPPDPPQPGCVPAGGGAPAVDGRQTLDGTITFECETGAESLTCLRGSTNVTLTARNLVVQRQSGGFPCELGMTVSGELDVEDVDRDADGRRCTTRYAQRLDSFFLAETPLEDGSSRIRQEGRLYVDSLGDLLFGRETPTGVTSGATPTPVGTPDSFVFPDGSNCPNASNGTLEVKRPPLVVDAPPVEEVAEEVSLAPQGSIPPEGRFEHDLFRAVNGQVYQVLRNVDRFANFGSEAIQVTSLIGSEAGGVGQCSVAAGATVDPQAVAAVEPGKAFPPGAVRKSMILPFVDNLQFNRDGNGTVCIGPGCDDSARCFGECEAFTVLDGTLITSDTPRFPAATLVPLSSFDDPCGGFARSGFFTYRFGDSGPTVETLQCSSFPESPAGDGFRIPNGSTVVFAYQASFASLFNAAVAGFPIDVENGNTIRCPADGNRALHLGVASLNSVQAPELAFTNTESGPAVQFDFDGDGNFDGAPTLGCVGISPLSECEP